MLIEVYSYKLSSFTPYSEMKSYIVFKFSVTDKKKDNPTPKRIKVRRLNCEMKFSWLVHSKSDTVLKYHKLAGRGFVTNTTTLSRFFFQHLTQTKLPTFAGACKTVIIFSLFLQALYN